MKKLSLKLEAGTAEIHLNLGGDEWLTQPLPALLDLEMQPGQQAVVRQTGGDELRLVAANIGDEMVQVDLMGEADTLTERYTLAVGQLRDPGNSVVLHGWEGDYFVLGEVPKPVAETLSFPTPPPDEPPAE